MHDRIDPVTVDRGRHEVCVAHVADDERQRLDRCGMSAPQVIDHDDAVPRIGEVARCQRTDVPGATCDQDVHRAADGRPSGVRAGVVRRRRELRRVGVLIGSGSTSRTGSGSDCTIGSGSTSPTGSGSDCTIGSGSTSRTGSERVRPRGPARKGSTSRTGSGSDCTIGARNDSRITGSRSG